MSVTITLTISDAAAAHVKAILDAENAQLGTSLTPRLLLLQLLRGFVLSRELADVTRAQREKADTDLDTALAAKQAEIDGLNIAPSV